MSEFPDLVYILENNLDRFRSVERGDAYDLQAFSFDGVMDVRRVEENKVLDLPNPTFFYQIHDNSNYINKLDSLATLEGCPIFSQRMIDVLLSVRQFKYRKYPIVILENRDCNPYEDIKKFKALSLRNDLFIFQALEFIDVFDWKKSDYRQGDLDKELGTPGRIRQFILNTPDGGFPPLFRLPPLQAINLFISREARKALKEAGVKGPDFTPLLRPRGNSETDVPMD
jgi:hypothetical protein